MVFMNKTSAFSAEALSLLGGPEQVYFLFLCIYAIHGILES